MAKKMKKKVVKGKPAKKQSKKNKGGRSPSNKDKKSKIKKILEFLKGKIRRKK